MEEQRISDLIHKYLANTATDQEREELLHWYRSVDHEEIHWPEDEATFEQRITHVFSNIKQSINLKQDQTIVSRKPKTPWKTISAAALLMVMLGIGLMLYLNKNETSESIVATIEPGRNKAVLTLSNGKTIMLGDSTNTTITLEDGKTLITDNGELVFQPDGQAHISPSQHMLTTPKGGQYTLRLSDGSKVALNVESTLSFPSFFAGDKRRVALEGEAYFEVAENKEKPFIIEMPHMEIEVLGTAFNVRNYPDEINIATSLVEGSVKVTSDQRELILSPGEAAILDKTTGSLRTIKVDLATETAWSKGYFIFNDQHIESIMKQLSRWYDVEVIYQGDLQDMRFSGRILRRSDITEVLDMLQLTGTIKFEIEGRRIIVMP